MEKPFVLVAIPFKGEISLLVEAVKSIFNSYVSGFSYSIVLWDDGSTDEELNQLWNALPKNILILKHDNVGYTKAMTSIIDFAKNDQRFDFLLACNSDVKFHTGSFHALTKRLMQNPNFAAVGCKVLKWGTDIIQTTGTILGDDGTSEHKMKVVDPHCGLQKDDPRTMHVERRLWANGCSVMYNLDILRKLGLNFDMEFTPCYFEEADLMTKLNFLGYPILYEPRAVIEHVVNATMNKEREKFEKVFWTNWDKYLQKWGPYFNSKQLQF
jgi:GT2 family glycosyltransferase